MFLLIYVTVNIKTVIL